MDVRHLILLRELADRGSITAVAQATHRTVSAVSQQLRTAQREFGMALVEPEGRGVRLTEAGRLLAAGGADVETALAQVAADWDAYRNTPGGSVSVLAFPSAASLFAPAVLRGASDVGIDVRMEDRDLTEAAYAGLTADFDIVVAHSLNGPSPSGCDDLVVYNLCVEPLDIAMRADHPLARKAELTVDDVAGEPWIGVPKGYPFDAVLIAVQQRIGANLRVDQRLCDNQLVETIVRDSDYLAVLPRFSTRTGEDLVTRPIVGVDARRYISAVIRPDRARRRAVRTVLDLMRDAVLDR